MNERVSYWLIPTEPDKTQLTEMIRLLASRFDAPLFEPHVTLYSGPLDSTERPDDIIRAVARGASEIVLDTTGIGHTQQFTKTLFLEFAPNEALDKLSGELKRHSSMSDDYDFKPHLSLVYATLSPEVTQRLARELSVPRRIRFDTVKAIISQGPTRTRADVEAWRIVANEKLAG
jgi:2'-5' RNA ligase